MALVFYGIAGEGRGHAARAVALIEELRLRGHRVVAYASGHALEILAPAYLRTDVVVRPLPRLEFTYGPDRRLDYVRSFFGVLPWIVRMPWIVDDVCRAIDRDQPSLIMSDFEPALPRAGQICGVPVISVDHQQFLVHCDLRELPVELRAYAGIMAPVVEYICHAQDESVVSSFFEAPVRASTTHKVTQVGVLLRNEVRDASVTEGDYLVAYLRRDSAGDALRAFEASGLPVHVYGLGKEGRRGRLDLRGIDPVAFVHDLAGARAFVTTAGNQGIGEAFWLRKPVLAMPEPGNMEQNINAYYLDRSGAGLSCNLATLEGATIRQFLAREDRYREAIWKMRRDGTAATLARIETHLSGASSRAVARRAPPPFRAPAFGRV